MVGLDERMAVDAAGSSTGPIWHQPVMPEIVINLLQPRAGQSIVDATVGAGGHSRLVLPYLAGGGRLIAIDQDADVLILARQRLREWDPQVTYLQGNFRELPRLLSTIGVERIDGLIADLGMSSVQVDQPERGFSFLREGPLDMRMDRSQSLSAAALLRTASLDELTHVLQTFGEERFARRIAGRIIEERRHARLVTTTQLVELVIRALPASARHGRRHAATRTFQAVRMAVNDELGALERLLGSLEQLLVPQGRAVMLTFHSLEDRAVKHAFAQGQQDGIWTVLTKKPRTPSEEDIAHNPRARSAKLRAVEARG